MLTRNDEEGVGGYGPFACPDGAPFPSPEEVKHTQDRHGGKFEDCPICFPKRTVV